MSLEALDWALKAHVKNPGAKFVLVILSNYANENNQCFPSVKHISNVTGISERTVNEHLTALEEDKLLQRTPRFLENGRQTSSVFTVGPDTLRNPQGMTISQGQYSANIAASADFAPHYTQEKNASLSFSCEKENEDTPGALPMSEKAKIYFRDFTALLVRHGTKEPSARSALGRLRKLYGDETVYNTYHQHAALLELKEGGAFEYFVGILKGVKAEEESRAAAATQVNKVPDQLLEQTNFFNQFGPQGTLAKAREAGEQVKPL